MFSQASTKLKSSLWLIAVAILSFSLVIEGSAKDLSKQANKRVTDVTLKKATNLASDARDASEKQIPVLMFFSMNHCPYCIEVEEDYLKPMLRNTEYDDKVIIRKIKIDGTDDIRDFTGKERDVEEFSDEYNISIVPTVILVDSKGKKIAPPIKGITNSHYYSYNLDKAIDQSTKRIRTLARR